MSEENNISKRTGEVVRETSGDIGDTIGSAIEGGMNALTGLVKGGAKIAGGLLKGTAKLGYTAVTTLGSEVIDTGREIGATAKAGFDQVKNDVTAATEKKPNPNALSAKQELALRCIEEDFEKAQKAMYARFNKQYTELKESFIKGETPKSTKRKPASRKSSSKQSHKVVTSKKSEQKDASTQTAS